MVSVRSFSVLETLAFGICCGEIAADTSIVLVRALPTTGKSANGTFARLVCGKAGLDGVSVTLAVAGRAVLEEAIKEPALSAITAFSMISRSFKVACTSTV